MENALYAHPAVQECAVIGAPCAERGQKVKAFVVLAPGYAPDAATATVLQDHVKAAIAPYKYPREIEFVEALPKTATGKLQRFALREPLGPQKRHNSPPRRRRAGRAGLKGEENQ